MSSCQEELLCKSLYKNMKIESISPCSKPITEGKLMATNHVPMGCAAQTISSLFTPKVPTMTAVEAIQRCNELELALSTERERVSELMRQLDQSQRMLSELQSTHSKCPVRMRFDDLPEELIVNIFSYLETDTLLDIVSVVSQKWNRLAHDVVLWSQLSLRTSQDLDIATVVRLMSFAPCLQSVWISSEQLHVHDDEDDESLQALTKSQCRVRSMTLPDFQPISIRMIRNQMGWLRHLHVNSWWDHMRAEYRDELWEVVSQLDLYSLTLHEHDGGNSYFLSPFRFQPGQMANLRHLDLYCKTVPGGILDSLLEACKEALETVALPPKAVGEQVALLSRCARLREANVPFLKEICALEHNPELELIEINAEWVVQPEVDSVITFLRMPKVQARLRTLFFQGMSVDCRRLLHAAALCKRLEYIRIHNFGEPEVVDAIISPLSALPLLERFTISAMPPSDVLDQILPMYCPELRELCIIGVCCDDMRGCRVPAIRRLLHLRPRLHVFLDLGLGVHRHLEGAFPECLREHATVCADESLWHRFHPVLVSHDPEACDWCSTKVESYATVVRMDGDLGCPAN